MLPYVLLLATLGADPAEAASVDDVLKPPATAFGPRGFDAPSKRGTRRGGSSSSGPKAPAPRPKPRPSSSSNKPAPKAKPAPRPSSPKPSASPPSRPDRSTSPSATPRNPRPATSVPPPSPRPKVPSSSTTPRPTTGSAPVRPESTAPSNPPRGGVPDARGGKQPPTTGGVPGTRGGSLPTTGVPGTRGGKPPATDRAPRTGLERPVQDLKHGPPRKLDLTRPTATEQVRRTLGADPARFADRLPPDTGPRPIGGTRPFKPDDEPARGHVRPPHRTEDHRYARPHHKHVHTHVHAHYVVPSWYYYRPWYTRWYVHPYYRWCYGTSVVVHFGFGTHAWMDSWIPPSRLGWTWVPGYWAWGYWHPGYWAPIAPPPTRYVFVPGWWEKRQEKEVYVEGYYRVDERDGWEWVDGFYLDDGTYVRGHWRPAGDAPSGYTWEPGFYDGETWVDGFWRPEFRKGFVWLASWFDEDGVFHSGYWLPQEERPGHVWVPGWFDGNQWVEGYWVAEETYRSADLQSWEAPEGWNAGWDEVDDVDDEEEDAGAPLAESVPPPEADQPDDLPLALPVVPGKPVED